jgi:hypothetical protein
MVIEYTNDYQITLNYTIYPPKIALKLPSIAKDTT